jgi:serine-type D-Ala-D-Ala endopeptidase (penicillin-binding protein 7)
VFPVRGALVLGVVATLGLLVPAPAVAASPGLSLECATRSGRKGVRAPRRSSAARRTRAIPWLKGGLPNVQAQGAFVLDLAAGQELYSRRPDELRPIASISKLAAALTVVDRGLDLDKTTTITRGDLDVARGGARSRLLEGMTLSNRDLLHAALLGSDNRAVPALGRAVGLDPQNFAVAMTQKARELGLKNARFVEPTGLSPENVATPREIVELMRAVMDHPVLGEITKTVEYDAHPVGRAPIRYHATYRSASRANTVVLGGKTGFNNAARYCLVLAARVAGRSLGMAFLGSEGELTRFGDVARVADWVVAEETRSNPIKTTVAAAATPAPKETTAAAAAPALPVGGGEAALGPGTVGFDPQAALTAALPRVSAAPVVPSPRPALGPAPLAPPPLLREDALLPPSVLVPKTATP